MVINPLLAIELKAIPNGNLTNDFYWRQKSSSLNVQRITPSVGVLFLPSKSIRPTWEKLNNQATLECGPCLTFTLPSLN